MPSRAPLTDEEMQALRDRMERYEAAKSTRTPPPAPSQTFGMRTHSARSTGPRQRYDPEAAAEARHRDRMRLAELRTTVDAQKAKDKAAQDVKRAARVAKDKENALRPIDDVNKGQGLKSGAFYQTVNPTDDTGKPWPYYKTSVAEDYAARQPSRDDRPISPFYNVTPAQYRAAYTIEYNPRDPNSMRRLIALTTPGSGLAYESERSVEDGLIESSYARSERQRIADQKPDYGKAKMLYDTDEEYRQRALGELEKDGTAQKYRDDAASDAELEKGRQVIEAAQDALGNNKPRAEFSLQGKVDRQIENERNKQASMVTDPLAQTISDRFGSQPTPLMSELMDPDSPMATGPGRKGLPRGTTKRR